MLRWPLLAALAALAAPALNAPPGLADEAPRVSALARMPIKEITVFKDGHAFVLHEGRMPTDPSGSVQMDYLPTPVLGTFWPYSADKGTRLVAVTASPRRVRVEQTALTAAELIEANPGVDVSITDTGGKTHVGQLVGVPTRSADELEATGLPNAPERLPEKAGIVLLKTQEGVETVPLEQVRNVTFKGPYTAKATREEFRNLLTLKLAWGAGKPAAAADVGMMYLQKGVRWIPGYKVTIDGKGAAVLTLQATLLNEMADLNDVTANLVVGVPSFAFKDTNDPIALQQTLAQLSQYFQTDARTGYAFSNAIMGQAARAGEYRAERAPAAPPAVDLGPEIAGGNRSEDLYVYTVRHITMKRGQRMVVPVAEYHLKYRDIFALDIPLAPPPEVRGTFNSEQQAEIARLLAAPKVEHRIRIVNDGKEPLTTAPALIILGDRPLGQGMTTYTSPGSTMDLAITTAVDVRPKVAEKETGRIPNAVQWQNSSYGRIDMGGTITLTNYRSAPADLEVSRYVLGQVDKADHDGTAAMVSPWSDQQVAADRPAWWGWYGWPVWWGHFNGIGRFDWKVRIDPGKSIDLGYTWHYFWQ